MTGFESQTVISKQLSLCLDVVLIVMAGFDSQVRFYVRLVLMKGKPSVITLKLNEVTGMETNSREIPVRTLNIFDVFNDYQFRGSITAVGKWSGIGDCIDPWYDIQQAIRKLPMTDRPFYLAMNARTKSYLYCVDYDRKPFYETIIPLFCHVCPVAEEVRKIIIEDLKDVILRTNNKIPDNMTLLVSDNNNVIIIDC